jgi:hypothetical protein
MDAGPIHVPPKPPGPRMVSVERRGNVVKVDMLCSDEYAAIALYERLCRAAEEDTSRPGRKA